MYIREKIEKNLTILAGEVGLEILNKDKFSEHVDQILTAFAEMVDKELKWCNDHPEIKRDKSRREGYVEALNFMLSKLKQTK